MDSFETVIAMLLTRCGYWSITSYRVILTPEEKRKIGRPSNSRWELDLVAYKASKNEILAVECKSLLDREECTAPLNLDHQKAFLSSYLLLVQSLMA
jgi:hypothetical protein